MASGVAWMDTRESHRRGAGAGAGAWMCAMVGLAAVRLGPPYGRFLRIRRVGRSARWDPVSRGCARASPTGAVPALARGCELARWWDSPRCGSAHPTVAFFGSVGWDAARDGI